MLSKFKNILVLVTVAFVGGSYLIKSCFGSGTLHVVTVGRGGIDVSVDGLPPLEQTQDEDHYTFNVSQGNHEVIVTDPKTGEATTYSVDVSAFSHLLLPVRADQCFVQFDMTNVSYESSRNTGRPPRATNVYKNDGQPIPVPVLTYFTFHEMPMKRKEHEVVYVLRDIPCSLAEPGTKRELLLVALTNQADMLFTNLEEIVKSQE